MTDVLERVAGTRRPHEFSTAACLTLASLSAGAGVVHLAMVPSHAGTAAFEGIAFAVAGWFQLAFAAVLVVGRSPFLLRLALLRFAVVANVAFIGAWAMSRTTGLPWGEHAWHPEAVGFVDVACVAMEAAFVVGACAVMARPRLGRGSRLSRLALGAIVPIGVLALATGALASPSARDHAGQSHGDHAADDHAAGDHDAGDHDGGAAAASGAETGVTDLNGHEIQGVKAHDVAAEEQPDELLDPPTRAALASQLSAARETALRYPTVADAESAGYHLVGGGYGPGAGAHYIGFGGGALGGFDAANPPTLIYDGTSPTAHIVGLMYLGMGANAAAPEGFAGPNDHWHRHSGVCLKGGEVIFPVDADVTEAQCTSKGGSYMKTTTWMVHAWVVPGWDSASGVFSHENPNLPCADGSFDTDAIGRCTGPGDVT